MVENQELSMRFLNPLVGGGLPHPKYKRRLSPGHLVLEPPVIILGSYSEVEVFLEDIVPASPCVAGRCILRRFVVVVRGVLLVLLGIGRWCRLRFGVLIVGLHGVLTGFRSERNRSEREYRNLRGTFRSGGHRVGTVLLDGTRSVRVVVGIVIITDGVMQWRPSLQCG